MLSVLEVFEIFLVADGADDVVYEGGEEGADDPEWMLPVGAEIAA